MNHLFEGCLSLISIPNISKWNISKVTDKSNIFDKCFNALVIPSFFNEINFHNNY